MPVSTCHNRFTRAVLAGQRRSALGSVSAGRTRLGGAPPEGAVGPVVIDWRVANFLRGVGADGRLGIEPVTTTLLVAAATAAIARYGPGVVEWVWDGIEDFLGLNTCSAENKKKHRGRINAVLAQGAEGIKLLTEQMTLGKMTGATGECLKYALKYAAARIIQEAEKAGLPVGDVEALKRIAASAGTSQAAADAERLNFDRARREAEAIANRSWANAEACRQAVSDHLKATGIVQWREINREVGPSCGRFASAAAPCEFPPELLLIGVDTAGYCAGSLASQAAARALVARLSAEQRARLATLPIGQRRAAVREMLPEAMVNGSGPIATGSSGSTALIVGLLIALAGGGYMLTRKDKAPKGRKEAV